MIAPKSIAQKMAYAEVASRASQLQEEQTELDTESQSLSSLQTALTSFQDAVDALNSDTDGPVVNTASSSDGSVTVTADSQAQAGTYTFFVDQLASAQQTTYSFADGDIPNGGTLTITMGDSEMDIDLAQADSDGDGTVTVSELADAINQSDENPGVAATVVNTGDTTTLMLTSDETGQASAFNVSVSGVDPTSAFCADINNAQTLSTAQDAIVYLGSSPQDGVEITNSSNTFDDVIPDVSITFTETSQEGDPVTFTIATDSGATQDKVQTFVDAYNTLVDTLDSLTTNGGDGTDPGPFAGDAGLESLENQLKEITHASYNGATIIDYGITLDDEGHLQIDADTFEQAVEENPDGLTSLFVGDDSMVSQIDTLLDSYLDASSGIITQRQQNISDQEDQLNDEITALTDTYNTDYQRYLEEYTQTLVEVASMKISMAAFA